MNKALFQLDWSLIQSFLAVSQEGSLSAAARQLKASQPTIGRHIAQMEAALNVTLFRRVPRGLELTSVGENLLPAAQDMGAAMRTLTLAAGGQDSAMAGTVRITASVFTAQYHLPKSIARIRREEPDIQIELVPNDAAENLLYRQADIAVRMFETTQLDVITQYLGGMELGLFVAKSYVDSMEPITQLSDLMKHDFIGYDTYDMMVQGMRDAGFDVNREWFKTRCDNHVTYLELLRAGCGFGFAQARIARSYPELIQIPLDGMNIPDLPVWLAAHEGMRHTPRIRRVWDILAEDLRQHLTPPSANS